MAFVRYKVVKGKKYYQWVSNYRENGKHKQKVLYHLGPNTPTPEAKISEEKKQLAHYRRKATRLGQKAEQLLEEIFEEWRFNDRIPGGYVDDFVVEVDTQAMIELLESYRSFFRHHKDHPLPLWWCEEFDEYSRELKALHDLYMAQDFNIWEEECQMEIDLYKKVEGYWRVRDSQFEAEDKAFEHEENLDMLRDLQKRYT